MFGLQNAKNPTPEHTTDIVCWGRFGENIARVILEKMPARSFGLRVFSEDAFGVSSVCPCPCAGAAFYSTLSGNEKEHWEECRIHVCHAGENFATGALTHFLHDPRKSSHTCDVGIVFLPPPGSNDATVGRFLTYMLCNENIFDMCVIVDACAPFVAGWTHEAIENCIASIVNIFSVFDRTSCMLPLLQRMEAKILGITFFPSVDGDLKTILTSNALINLHGVMLPRRYEDYLAFSVSGKKVVNYKLFFSSIFPTNKLMHIPFTRTYEWSRFVLPGCFSYTGKPSEEFAAILYGNCVSRRILRLLNRYFSVCWLTKNRKLRRFEEPSPEAARWLKSQGRGTVRMQTGTHILQLLEAWKFVSSTLGTRKD